MEKMAGRGGLRPRKSGRPEMLACLLLLVLTLIHPRTAMAMSYVPMADQDLLAQSDLVVDAIVASAGPLPGLDLERTRYVLTVIEALKGAADAMITVEVPGAFDVEARGARVVASMPRFAPGERVLLFLGRRADGSYRLVQAWLGAFRHQADAAEGFYERESPQPFARHAGRFKDWLRNGARDATAYWMTAPPRPLAKFSMAGEPASRWFELDEGHDIGWSMGPSGLIGLAGGGLGDFQQALNAWNQDAGSRVSFRLLGSASVGTGLGSADGLNQLLFEDPLGDLAGRFSCATGGIIAYTRFRYGALRNFQGRLYRAISEADIVVQDGAGCLLSAPGNAAEVLAHELGHALGLGHSCGDAGLPECVPGSPTGEAVMRPTLHGDGRGAALNSDDRAGVAALYPALDTNSGNPSAVAPPAGPAGKSGGAVGILVLLAAGLAALRGPRRALSR
jgi:hypothetical protein